MSRDRKQNIEFGRVSQEYLASPGGGAEPSDLFQASRRRPGAGLRPTPARQAVELSVVLTITTARRFGPLSSVRFIGFHSPHQLCQFLREGRRNNVVECPPQVAPSVSGNFIGSSGAGGQPRMGTPLQEKRSPRLLCLENVPGGAAFHFNEESVPLPPGHPRRKNSKGHAGAGLPHCRNQIGAL